MEATGKRVFRLSGAFGELSIVLSLRSSYHLFELVGRVEADVRNPGAAVRRVDDASDFWFKIGTYFIQKVLQRGVIRSLSYCGATGVDLSNLLEVYFNSIHTDVLANEMQERKRFCHRV